MAACRACENAAVSVRCSTCEARRTLQWCERASTRHTAVSERRHACNAALSCRSTLLPQHSAAVQLVEVVCCKMTQLQRELYNHFLDSKAAARLLASRQGTQSKGGTRVLGAITALKKLCNHPKLIYDVVHGKGGDKVSGFEGCTKFFPAGAPLAARCCTTLAAPRPLALQALLDLRRMHSRHRVAGQQWVPQPRLLLTPHLCHRHHRRRSHKGLTWKRTLSGHNENDAASLGEECGGSPMDTPRAAEAAWPV
jgi:SNF2-related domain